MTLAPNYAMLASEAANEIMRSRRLQCLTTRPRAERASNAALHVLLAGGSEEEARDKFRSSMVGMWPVVLLIASIAWDIFWAWWQRRNLETGMGS